MKARNPTAAVLTHAKKLLALIPPNLALSAGELEDLEDLIGAALNRVKGIRAGGLFTDENVPKPPSEEQLRAAMDRFQPPSPEQLAEWQEMTRQRQPPRVPPSSAEVAERTRTVLTAGIEKLNAPGILNALYRSLLHSIAQKRIADEVFRLLSVARDMAAFIIDDDVLDRVADAFSAVAEGRRSSPSPAPAPAPTPAANARTQLDKIMAKAKREALAPFVEQALRLCLAEETDHPMDVAKVSRVLLNVGVDKRTANVPSLHARLGRMRRSGFKQVSVQGRGRRRGEAEPDLEDKSKAPSDVLWNPTYANLLRVAMSEALDVPSNADQDQETRLAATFFASFLLEAQKVDRH